MNDDWKIGSPHRSEPYSCNNDVIKRRGFRWNDSQSHDAARSRSCEPYLLGGETAHSIYYTVNRMTGSHTPISLHTAKGAYVIGINGSTNNVKHEKVKKYRIEDVESCGELGAPLCWADELSRSNSKIITPRNSVSRQRSNGYLSEEKHSVVFQKEPVNSNKYDFLPTPPSRPGGYKVSRVDRRLSDKRRITDICITNKEGLASIEDNEAYEKLLESYRTVDEEAGGGVAFSPRAENARHSRQRAAHNERASRPEAHVSVGRRYEPPPTPVGRPGTAIGYVRPARAELTIRGGAPPAECPPLVVSGSTRDQVAAAPTPATTPATHVGQRAHHQRALLYCAPLVGEHTHTEYISIASRMKTQADCGPPTPPTTTHATPTRAEPTRDTPKHATSTRATMTHATAAYSAPTPATPPKQLAARKTTTAPAPLMPPTLPLRPPSPPAISTRSLCVEKPMVAEATPLTPAPPVARKETVAQASAREYAFNIPTGSTELLDASDCETTKEAAGGVANDDDLVYAAAGIVNSAITSATELLGGDLTPSRKGSGSGRPGEVEIRSVTFLTDSV